jgi:hypothetical protein
LTRRTITLSFWRSHNDPARLLAEVRQRYRSSPAFARLLHAAVTVNLKGGEVVLEGKANACKVLRHVLRKLLEQEQADVPAGKIGKWQWLELTAHPRTGRRVWRKVSRARAWAHVLDAGTCELPLTLTRVLGYPASITREQARRFEQAHYPPLVVLVEGPEAWTDPSHDLDLNQNEHFRDDRGSYDDAGVLQPPRAPGRAAWETAYRTKHEAWNGVREDEAARAYRVGGRFYPARVWSREYRHVDGHGVMRLLELRDHLAACRKAVADLSRRQALAPRQPADGGWWTMSGPEREMLTAGEELRRRQLAYDDAEVAAHARVDVPESDLELLEEQVARTPGKAPCGLIAALAHARLAAWRRDEQRRWHQEGLKALERAVRHPSS